MPTEIPTSAANRPTKANPWPTFGNGSDDTSCFLSRAGVSRIQTRIPSIAKKLGRLAGGKLVASGMNCYLRIYEFENGFGWAKKWVQRNTTVKQP